MYATTLTYEDLDGNSVTENAYFHMSARDWALVDDEMRPRYPGGYQEYLETQLKDGSAKSILEALDDIVKRAYGVRSADGKKFIKNDEVTEAFIGSMAYDAFLDELLFKTGASDVFIASVIPKEMRAKAGTTPHGMD